MNKSGNVPLYCMTWLQWQDHNQGFKYTEAEKFRLATKLHAVQRENQKISHICTHLAVQM